MITEENKQKIMNAVRDILEAVGEDVNRPGLIETPKRVANMYEEMFAGLDNDATQHLKLFDEKSNDEMVIVRDIPFSNTICFRLWVRLISLIFRRITKFSDFQNLRELLTILQSVRRFRSV